MSSPRSLHSKILLVDANSDGLLVRRSLLEEAGYEVDSAKSGQEALARFEAAVHGVVVAGCRMPKMSGGELTGKLRQIHPNVRVILLSGYLEALGVDDANMQADVVITKNSSEPANLLRWVKRLQNGSSIRKPAGSHKRTGASSSRTGTH
jgi:CheY-like chemotaxis protein